MRRAGEPDRGSHGLPRWPRPPDGHRSRHDGRGGGGGDLVSSPPRTKTSPPSYRLTSMTRRRSSPVGPACGRRRRRGPAGDRVHRVRHHVVAHRRRPVLQRRPGGGGGPGPRFRGEHVGAGRRLPAGRAGGFWRAVGIMDQLASAAGVEGHALLVDCRSLDFRPVTVPDDLEIVVVDSGQARTLVGSVRRAPSPSRDGRVRHRLGSGRQHDRPAAARGPGHRGPGPACHQRERPGVGLRRGPPRGLARRGGRPDGRQPRQPARRLRGLHPDAGCPGRTPVGSARRVRRLPHRGRVRRCVVAAHHPARWTRGGSCSPQPAPD
jgi:hypothetical protein